MEPSIRINYGRAYTEMVIRGLNEGQIVRTMFSGRSMIPTLREGMQILLERAEPGQIKPADIIMYRKADRAIVHRVVGIIRQNQNRLFVTKGDNHAYISSDYIPEKDLIGRVKGAFFENEPDRDVLVKNRAIGILYVVLGQSVLAARRARIYIPQRVRLIFKYLVGGFFFAAKKAIHVISAGLLRRRMRSSK
jgi:signal peptidase I